jgi:hypothetical protein
VSRWAAGRIFDGSSSSGAVRPFGRILGCTTRCLEGRWPARGELARPSSDAVLASPEVTVSSPGLLPDRARAYLGEHLIRSQARRVRPVRPSPR